MNGQDQLARGRAVVTDTSPHVEPGAPYRVGEAEHGVLLTQAGRCPVLNAAQLEALRSYGTEHEVAAGEVLFAEGDETYDLIVVLEGEIQIVGSADRPA